MSRKGIEPARSFCQQNVGTSNDRSAYTFSCIWSIYKTSTLYSWCIFTLFGSLHRHGLVRGGDIYKHIYTYTYMYIYIYVERESERDIHIVVRLLLQKPWLSPGLALFGADPDVHGLGVVSTMIWVDRLPRWAIIWDDPTQVSYCLGRSFANWTSDDIHS